LLQTIKRILIEADSGVIITCLVNKEWLRRNQKTAGGLQTPRTGMLHKSDCMGSQQITGDATCVLATESTDTPNIWTVR
jgi:hypothetical protein